MTKDATYGAIPTAEALPMVEVTAPANLQEGYKFTAVYEGVEFPVIVPAGGCTKGEVLIVPFKGGSAASRSGWKDDIFACTRYGIFHPSLILACCCRPFLLGQVMTRLKLDWKGNPDGEWKKTFRIMCYVFGAYLILSLFFTPANISYDDGVAQEEQNPLWQFVSFVLFVFMVYLISKVRKTIRERDQISEERCVGCEDVVCACCCACCTVSQMARQTADYDVTEGHYFTSDGLPPPPTPVIIV
jgi:Cys-rich protein (TIGR01571 family)